MAGKVALVGHEIHLSLHVSLKLSSRNLTKISRALNSPEVGMATCEDCISCNWVCNHCASLCAQYMLSTTACARAIMGDMFPTNKKESAIIITVLRIIAAMLAAACRYSMIIRSNV